MKRKNLAIALTGILALPLWVPVASAAGLTVYGKAHGSLDFDSNDEEAANQEKSTVAFSNNASRIGFKGAEQINDKLSVTYQAETTFNLDTGGWGSGRNTYVGLKDGFGEVRFGKHDTPYKLATNDPFADTRGDYNAVIGNVNGKVLFDERDANSIVYLSPDMNGLKFLAAYILGIDDTQFSSSDPATDTNDDLPKGSDPKNTGISAAATYTSGALSLSAAIENISSGCNSTSNTTYCPTTRDDAKAKKLGAGWDFGQGTNLNLIYETAESGVTDVKRNAMYLQAAHKMGDTTLRLGYGVLDDLDTGSNTGATHMVLGVSQKLSKDTEVYALYASTSNDDGVKYSLEGVSAPPTATGPTISSFSFGIVKNFSADLM